MNEWWIDKISIQDDHVHILIQINPRDSVAEVVRLLKGATSRIIRQEFGEYEEFLWGKNFRSDGYFAETVGKVDEAVIRKYIENHQIRK